jgi:hypothetical protein
VAFHRSKGFYRALGAAFLAASIADKFRSDRPFLIGFLLLALVMTALEYRRWLWLLPRLRCGRTCMADSSGLGAAGGLLRRGSVSAMARQAGGR